MWYKTKLSKQAMQSLCQLIALEIKRKNCILPASINDILELSKTNVERATEKLANIIKGIKYDYDIRRKTNGI